MIISDHNYYADFIRDTATEVYDAFYYHDGDQGIIRLRFKNTYSSKYKETEAMMLSLLSLQKYEIIGFRKQSQQELYISKLSTYPKPDEWLKLKKEVS